MSPALRIARFRRAEEGTVLVFWGVSLAVLLGLAAMAFDMGRVAVTQTDLQSYADSVALAAAGELDAKPDSISRAQDAAAQMIEDWQSYGTAGNNHTLSGKGGDLDYQLFFYETLPANDSAALAGALDPNDASDAVKAAFVRVVVDTHTVDLTFAAAFAALTGTNPMNNSVNAEAVAGFALYACDITPMVFCLPQPSLDVSKGQMIKMVSQGGGSEQWGAGNFGFLAANEIVAMDESGACAPAPNGQQTACALAASKAVSQCFSQRGVETKPGLSVGNMIAGFNTRFDQYDATSKQFRNDKKYDVDNFAAAPNVLDGWITTAQGSKCTTESAPYDEDGDGAADPDATVGLPLDDCFAGSGACPVYEVDADGNTVTDLNGDPVQAVDSQGDPLTTRVGDSDFGAGLKEYLTVNYGVDYSSGTPVGIPAWFPTSGTRYDIYNAEINHQSDLQARLSALGKAESSLPGCQPPSTAAADPARRVIIAAGIDCDSYASELNGGSGTIPVDKFVEVFLVRPAESDGTGAKAVIYAEVIGTAGGGSGNGLGGLVHDVVQLYR